MLGCNRHSTAGNPFRKARSRLLEGGRGVDTWAVPCDRDAIWPRQPNVGPPYSLAAFIFARMFSGGTMSRVV
jgi:hypothetical protein